MELTSILRIGAAIVAILMGTAAGLHFSCRLKMREESLRELISLLREMALLIRHRALPVRDLFAELSRYEFIRIVDKSGCKDFRNDWGAAANSLTELEEPERSILKSIGQSLGASDIDGQLVMLEVSIQQLEKYANEAHEQLMKKGKLYRTMGVLAGLFVAILII